jgi:hypothetical protein
LWGLSTRSAAAIEALYSVAQRISKPKKPPTIAEELIPPCAKNFVSILIESDSLNYSHSLY